MTKHEHELNDYLLEQGWREGAATPERLSSFLERRTLQNKLAAVAMVAAERTDLEEIDLLADAA